METRSELGLQGELGIVPESRKENWKKALKHFKFKQKFKLVLSVNQIFS